jgi:hypothetical protein
LREPLTAALSAGRAAAKAGPADLAVPACSASIPIPIAQSVSHEPTPLPATRLPFERHIFSVDAAVTLVRHEADEDFHLVLQSGTDQMIAESPSSSCALGATPIGAGRCAWHGRSCGSARRRASSAVAFFDFKHGQTGVAPNAIELHPILSFACLSRLGRSRGREHPVEQPSPALAFTTEEVGR